MLFRTTLGGATASIDTGAVLASTFDILEAFIVARTTAAVIQSSLTMTVNGDTGANYDRERAGAQNTGDTNTGAAGANNWAFFCHGDAAGVAAYYSFFHVIIPWYNEVTTHNKVGYASDGILDDTAGEQQQDSYQLGWRSTAAINRLTVTAGSGNLMAGSRLLVVGR